MKPLMISVLALSMSACFPNYSNGERVGTVTKLSEKGMIFKSWEGEMLMALPQSVAGTAIPEKFTFNVDEKAVEAVKEALASGKRVTLEYRQWGIAPPTIDHQHVVIGVK